MKQIQQSLRSGEVELVELPCPAVGRGQLLIQSSRTLVSAGTERMLLEFGRAGWLDKARRHPEKVRQVLAKVSTDGLFPAVEAVRRKLDEPIALGYCNSGVVVDVGAGVSGYRIGDRVVSNGSHSEMVVVPVNLCARIPDAVDDDAAAFTVLGAVALQGVRLVKPTLGETVVVMGLGLLGLLTVQLLRAHGCKVLAMDFDRSRLELGRMAGAATLDMASGLDPVESAVDWSRGRGVDAVIIAASTSSNDPVSHAARMCRKRGRIVLVGVTGLELSRADFYEKELTFQVSCSYGPGRYDPAYEQLGQDYPIGFVRWTEQRNFEAVLDMLADGRLNVASLVSHRFAIDEAERAYSVVGGSEPSLGILLTYPRPALEKDSEPRSRTVNLLREQMPGARRDPGVSMIGAGQYAGGVLAPAFRDAGVALRYVASSGGASGAHLGRKFGFAHATTDTSSILADPATQIVVVSTRHDTHARYVVSALAAGKHVFVEKPLALTRDELAQVAAAAAAAPQQLLMVGFNRRFAPHVRRIKALLEAVPGPKALVMTVNAGHIPASHWTQDREVGGGRLLGEGCHFVDLLRFLANSPVIGQSVARLESATADTATIVIRFEDRSLGTIHYLGNGSKAFPKERLEVFAAGRVLQLDNFRQLKAFGWPGFNRMRLWKQDKGQTACVQAFVDAVRSGAPSPIPLDQVLEVARVSIDIAEAAR